MLPDTAPQARRAAAGFLLRRPLPRLPAPSTNPHPLAQRAARSFSHLLPELHADGGRPPGLLPRLPAPSTPTPSTPTALGRAARFFRTCFLNCMPIVAGLLAFSWSERSSWKSRASSGCVESSMTVRRSCVSVDRFLSTKASTLYTTSPVGGMPRGMPTPVYRSGLLTHPRALCVCDEHGGRLPLLQAGDEVLAVSVLDVGQEAVDLVPHCLLCLSCLSCLCASLTAPVVVPAHRRSVGCRTGWARRRSGS